MLPLSGGADSGLTAGILYYFSNKLMDYLTNRGAAIREEILTSLRQAVKDAEFDPQGPKDIMAKILYTRYMACEYSSEETKSRSAKLAEQLGITGHQAVDFTDIYQAFKKIINDTMGLDPKFKTQGGAWREDIAL
jgi:NH3-dependent NAD+ synthetase